MKVTVTLAPMAHICIVAFPESTEQVRELLAYARENNLVVIPYGGGTSVVGHINPVKSSRPILTIDMGKMSSLLSIDTESQLATFGAGTPGLLPRKVHGFSILCCSFDHEKSDESHQTIR